MSDETCSLAEKECKPCQGGVPPLAGEELKKLQDELGNDWQVIANAILEFLGIALILMQSKLNAKSQPPSPRRASCWVKQLSWAVTLVNISKQAVSLRGWSLRDKAKNVYGLSG